MQQILLVGLGGCLGSIARYQLSGLVLHHTVEWRFPLPTFLVNVVGCLVAGVLSGLIERYGWFSPNTRYYCSPAYLAASPRFRRSESKPRTCLSVAK